MILYRYKIEIIVETEDDNTFGAYSAGMLQPTVELLLAAAAIKKADLVIKQLSEKTIKHELPDARLSMTLTKEEISPH